MRALVFLLMALALRDGWLSPPHAVHAAPLGGYSLGVMTGQLAAGYGDGVTPVRGSLGRVGW